MNIPCKYCCTFKLTDTQSFEKFVEDYRFTACSSVLRWYHEKWQQDLVLYITPESSFLSSAATSNNGELNEQPTTTAALSVGGRESWHGLTVTSAVVFSLNFCLKKLCMDEVEDNGKMPFTWTAFFNFFYALSKKDFIEVIVDPPDPEQ